MANRVMGYVICGYNSVDNLLSEQSSPFRRWTTGSGAGSSYRQHDHRNMYNKQMSEGTGVCAGGGGGGTGRVSRWSLGLEQLLADPAGAAAFAHFLAKEFAAENIKFWWSCEQYTSCSDDARASLAVEIWQRHLAEGAPEPVNVDAAARRLAAPLRAPHPPPADLFLQAQKQIFNVMKFDSYPRFLRSNVHAECARADLCGLPLPYCNNDTPTKLKKSASNASERRRSGGASLLPWKLRAPSKDRATPVEKPNPPPVTDVVKSSQSTGQCSLCRVVLPDGATSVVGVEAGVTVRALVDRLLQRRNLHCLTYDVLLKDIAQGESPSVELSGPCVVLGGREVVVERRVVVRVEVGGRCVAVRCRGARRLRHVLRPVLARYLPAGGAGAGAGAGGGQRLVLRDGVHVRPDTLMQDLDGARLQIIEVSENGEWRSGEGRDDDADSLSDLAVRLQDDDTQSASAASTSSRSRGDSASNGPLTSTSSLGLNGPSISLPNNGSLGPSSGGLGLSNGGLGPSNGGLGPSNGGLGPSNGGSGANGGPGGRVRAALRSGPPLHHHPPDFLDNLRETQRQRLQTKPEGGARPPPPLPPKPPHRSAPTVV